MYGINVLSFEDINVRNSYKQYFIPLVEIKDYNVMIDGRNSFDQLLQNNLRTNDNIATGHGDDYTIVCLLHYPYFEKCYKLIAIDLTKQPKRNADPKAIRQIIFTGNLKEHNATIFFIIQEAKETILDFSQEL